MKSYLSLVPISAKVHRRQNRITLLCIIISVFLITSVFSLADMMIRTQTARMLDRHGNWHIKLTNLAESDAQEIERRPDVTAAGWCGVFNYEGGEPYYINGTKAVVYGTDETYITRIMNGLDEGTFPANDREVMLDINAKSLLNVTVGDHVTLTTPAGTMDYIISGFGEDDSSYYQGQSFLIGVYLTRNAFGAVLEQNGLLNNPAFHVQFQFYIQFQNAKKAAAARTELPEQYGLPEDAVFENTALMGMSGQSEKQYMKNWYQTAAIVSAMVLLSGALMISSSMNSNVAQRTQFFGMLRCIGASRRQIIRFVRMEALNWCRTAIPIGILLGTAATWGICAILRYAIGYEFLSTPVFSISPAGILSGVVIGIATVLAAASAPARRAAKVSPMTAVSNGAQTMQHMRRAVSGGLGRIDVALGVHHAVSAKKNWFLMTSSFALGIILFFAFTIGLNFAYVLVPALRPWQPDCTIVGYDNALSLDKGLIEEIGKIPGVGRVYGNIYLSDIPASSAQTSIDHVNLVSYDEYMLDCSAKSVIDGKLSGVYGDSNQVLTIYNKNNPLKVGDVIQMAGTQVEIACAVSDGLFADDLIVICSEETFTRLMGEQNYCMINMQLNSDATENTIRAIRSLADEDQIFSDNRENNRSSTSFFWATRILVYGFLAIIGMITAFHIVNSISMSVSARVRQYGAMRAVGMDGKQLARMIAAESFTYAVSGYLAGCALGLPLSRWLYTVLITSHFGLVWKIPVSSLLITLLFVLAASAAAILSPAKRIQRMAVTDTINEL